MRRFILALSLTVLTPWLTASGMAEEARRAPVRVIIARENPIKQVLEFSGSVTAVRAAALSPATAGLVAGIRVDAGDHVEKGDVLLMLDDELARYQLAGDEAAVSRARQSVSDARRRLREAGELSEKATIAETAVRDLESEVIEDEAQLAQLTALAGRSRATLERHTLVAPFSGVISARSAELGEWVAPGATVFQLVSLEQLYVDIQVSETYLGAIHLGMPLELRFAASGSDPVAATVAATVPVTDPTARTFLVRARADTLLKAMLPGMSATANLTLDTGRARVTVPRDAILRHPDGRSVVWVIETVDGIDRSDERIITTGLSFDGQIEVLDGLRSGERVVVVGNESLRDDQPVRVLGEN